MGKNSFILYTEIWPAIQKLDMEQRGKLFTAVMKHALGESPEKLDILTDVIFTFIASQMDRAEEKYRDVCKRRAEYGRKGGLASAKAKASKSKQKQANQADSDSERDSDSEPERESESDSEAQAPWESLSPEEDENLRGIYGSRAENLVEDVRLYYQTHPEKMFPGWPVAMATFDRNQERWGRGGASHSQTIEDMVAKAFGGKQ